MSSTVRFGKTLPLLRHQAHAAHRLLERAVVRGLVTGERHLPARTGKQAVDSLQQRGLAGAIVAEQADDASLADRDVDLVQHLEGAVGDVDAANLKHGRLAPDIRE